MQFLLDCATTALTVVLCFLMIYHKYEIKSDFLTLRIIGVICIIAAKMATLALHIPPLNLLTIWIVCISVLSIYKCKLITGFIYSLMFLMLALVSDTVGVLIAASFYDHTITETLGATGLIWQSHIWTWILQIFLSRITATIICKNNNIRVKWHEIIFYILLFLFQIMLFASISAKVQNYMSGQFLVFMMIGFIILDIFIMYILHKISLLRENEQKINLMQQQEQLQLNMYQELQKKYNKTCAIAHDINRHIKSLKSLITLTPNGQAENYLADLSNETARLCPNVKNQNPMLEIILNTMLEKCEKNNIVFEMNVEDFPMSFISDIDITTIFSNLFDNAVDACMELSKSQRKIHFVLKTQMGLIVIRITNSCKHSDTSEFCFYHSTKENHSGIGLSNVRKSVEKYEGVFSVRQEENQFCVSITFNENM